MWATKATIDITNETMVLYNAKVLAKKDIYHLEGKQITKLEGPNYVVPGQLFHDLRMREGHARLVDKREADDREHGAYRPRLRTPPSTLPATP